MMKKNYLYILLFISSLFFAQNGADIKDLVKLNSAQAVNTNRILVTDGNGNLGFRTFSGVANTATTLNAGVQKTSIAKPAIFRNLPDLKVNRFITVDDAGNLGYRDLSFVASSSPTTASGKIGLSAVNFISLGTILSTQQNSYGYAVVIDGNGVLGKRPFSDIVYTSTRTASCSGNFTRNNCPAGNSPGTVTYSQSASATATSTVSQSDADNNAYNSAYTQACNLVNAGGQNYANNNAGCTPTATGTADFAAPKVRYIASTDWAGQAYQGKLNNTNRKLSVRIPYSNGQGSYTAYSSSVSVTGQGGDTNTLTLSYPAGSFTSPTGNIIATISVSGSDNEFLVKRMGTLQEELITTIPVGLNGVNKTSFTMIAIGGIPDKKFLENDDHIFLYRPVTGDDNKGWLNLNLGAKYSDSSFSNEDFNPKQQATTLGDYMAYGSLIQWGRETDGHELIDWSSETSGTPRYNKAWYDYTQLPNYNYDPCPVNYRTPTIAEWENYRTAAVNNNSATDVSDFLQSPLRLTVSGDRNYSNGTFEYVNQNGLYWSSTKNTTSGQGGTSEKGAMGLYISRTSNFGIYSSTVTYLDYFYMRGDGFNVRCIKP